MESDPVKKPAHYQLPDGAEAIDLIAEELRRKFGDNGFRAHCYGTFLKYVARATQKGTFLQDAGKAAMYLHWAERDPEKPSQDRSSL